MYFSGPQLLFKSISFIGKKIQVKNYYFIFYNKYRSSNFPFKLIVICKTKMPMSKAFEWNDNVN